MIKKAICKESLLPQIFTDVNALLIFSSIYSINFNYPTILSPIHSVVFKEKFRINLLILEHSNIERNNHKIILLLNV